MADQQSTRRVIALALMCSAALLLVVASLIYTGVIPMPAEIRPIGAGIVGLAAFADFAIGLWFFRMSQSS